jgi:uncharacterized protein YecT (DUF1311 family)
MIKAFAFVLLSAGTVVAQDISAIDCTNTVMQQEMNACAEQDWMDADADLNAAYRAAMAVMKGYDADLAKSERGAEANLRNAQRAWITYRDAACAAEGYAMHGGSAEPLLIYGCRARLTEQRAEDLRLLTAY